MRNRTGIDPHHKKTCGQCSTPAENDGRRNDMFISINCREIGMDCDFVVHGDTEDSVMEMIMRHVNDVHAEDWYETEELYRVAMMKIREKAA
ncbi:MAG: DUF1059 domain-containing protein [Deltaproteobacteria bacterium]|nr:DUF1059 domain-containing protein [Deltaproteobacteria bacterium]